MAILSELADFDVLCIEQPLPPADLVAHAQLARVLPVPICLDESLSTPRRLTDALRNGSCAMACLKPARLGGVRATRAAHAACAAAGVPAFVGGFFEAGLGRAANLALAARLSQDATGLVSDVGDPADYLAVDPCGYPAVHSGWVRCLVPPASGTPLTARFWRSSKCGVAGSPPPTLDPPCIASSWSGGSEMSTPGLSGRGRSWPC